MTDDHLYADVVQLLHRIARGSDTRDLEAFLECFDDDVVMKYVVAGQRLPDVEGKAALRARNRAFFVSNPETRRHFTTNTIIERSTDDEVVAYSYLLLVVVDEDGEPRIQTTGLYRDVIRRREDSWRVRERSIDLDLAYT